MNCSSAHNLVDLLLKRSNSVNGVNIVRGHDQIEYIAYKDMLLRAQHRLSQFQRSGLKSGDSLIIQTNDNARFVEAFWACLLGGVVAVPIAAGNSEEHRLKLFRIAEKLGDAGLYMDGDSLNRLKDVADKHNYAAAFGRLSGAWIDSSSNAPDKLPEMIYQASPGDVAFIQFSSGSTSAPKGVVLTHENLMVNTRAIIAACEMNDADHLFSWMPLTHDMGLVGFHLTAVVKGVSHTLMGTELFVRRPALWLTEAERVGATMLCSPNFGYEHLLKSFKPEKYENLDLRKIRLVFNGAEPISVSLCHQFMQTLAPFGLSADAMCPVYGLAEASLAVSFPTMNNRFNTVSVDRGQIGIGEAVQIREAEQAANCIEFVSVGQALNDVEIDIRGHANQSYDDCVTGNIFIRGKNVTSGYYKEAELNALTITSDGWLNTGDLGFVHNNLLFITGREKDIIFVNGQNVYPHDLEEMIYQADILDRGKLAISSRRKDDDSEELVAFVLHRGEADGLADAGKTMTRLLSEAAGVSLSSIVPVSRIPKTTSGKIQRFALVAALEDGQLDAIRVANSEQDAVNNAPSEDMDADSGVDLDSGSTAERLLRICNEQVEGMNVAAGDNLFELGISSLTLAQIHAAIEEQWPDQVDITDLFDYPSVDELAGFLDEKVAA